MKKSTSDAQADTKDRRAGTEQGAKPPRPAKARGPARSKKPAAAPKPGTDLDPSVQRRAAAILEVLAGERTAAEAASLLGISAMHYYLLERRALQGLVAACAPRAKGPAGPGPEQELSRLQRELDRSRRECLRQAALVRVTQRAIGLPAAAAPSAKDKAKPANANAKRPRRRRRTVRALRAAQSLRQNSSGPPAADVVEQLPSQGTDPLGMRLPTAPPLSSRSRKDSQEPADDRQEAAGHTPCGATGGIGVGQAAPDGAAGDAPG